MRFQPSLFVVAAFLVAQSSVHADECTVDQLNAFTASRSDFEELGKGCDAVMSNPEANGPDAVKFICSSEKCGGLIKKLVSKIPKCTVSGVSVTEQVDKFLTKCNETPSDPTTSVTTPPANNNSTGSADNSTSTVPANNSTDTVPANNNTDTVTNDNNENKSLPPPAQKKSNAHLATFGFAATAVMVTGAVAWN